MHAKFYTGKLKQIKNKPLGRTRLDEEREQYLNYHQRSMGKLN
jgi:hypothetical protein